MSRNRNVVSNNEVRVEEEQTKQQQLKLQRVFFGSRAISMTIRTLVWGGVVAYLVFNIKDVLVSYAGKETAANVVINLLADVRIPEWIAYIFGGGGTIYGLQQRRLRKKTVADLSEHAEELELHFDPNRRSSNLNRNGENAKEDLK